jgi:Uma2 family endonuclease
LSVEELLALPEDGVDREFIGGELKERPMTLRNADPREIPITIGHVLRLWRDSLPPPRGKVVGGKAAFRLRPEPRSFVGIDVAYVSDEVPVVRYKNRKYFDGAPVLAVKILSPSDQFGDMADKVRDYLEVGSVVWVVDPEFRSMTVRRPGEPRKVHDDTEDLAGDPYLHGFRVDVA